LHLWVHINLLSCIFFSTEVFIVTKINTFFD